MPGTYPPAPPTLAGDLLTIHRLLKSPTEIRRRLQTLADLRFVADQILTQRIRTSGGAVQYEVSEPLFNEREVGAVSPGSEYPRDTPAHGAAALASVTKWGQAVRLTDEQLKRSVYMGDEVDRALRKLLNTVIRKVDRLAIAAVATAVVQTSPVTGGGWEGDTAKMLRDLEVAKAIVEDLDMGYRLDTILMSTNKKAMLLSDEKIALLRRRETENNPVYGGPIDEIAGLAVVTTSEGNLPGGTDDVWLLDSTQLGGMADELEVDPGYSVAEMGVQVQTQRKPEIDAWDMWARRITVPVVREPGAAIRITGTDGS
jgi:hypothetical protein